MRNLLLVAAVLALISAVAAPSNAQSKFSVSVGADILFPSGDFKNIYSTGYGPSARGQYDVTPTLGVGLEAGYVVFTAKDVPAGQTKPSFYTIPVRVFGKYYLMGEGSGLRVYGMVGLGFWFWSETVKPLPAPSPLGVVLANSVTTSKADFNYLPVLGVELPGEKVKVDASIRYEGVATSGSSTKLVAGRLALLFPL